MQPISLISMTKNTGTHWVLLFFNRNTAVYFDSFGIKYIPQEVLNKIREKWIITHDILRIQNNSSIMCGFYCIAFIEYMLPEKSLLDCTIYFLRMNGKIIYKYFKEKYVKSQV